MSIRFNSDNTGPSQSPEDQQASHKPEDSTKNCISCGKPFIPSNQNLVCCFACWEDCKKKDGRP